MANTHILEFSRDPLSDITPTWVDISAYLLEVQDCTIGVGGDLDEPQPGTATFRLNNRDRRFEPEYAAGAYYPDIRPLRRIRWRIDDGSIIHDMFLGYVVDWGPSWPDDLMNQEAIVRCVDGFELLALDHLGPLDPPEASSYADVVMFDEPFWYGRLGETKGTKVAAVTGAEGAYRKAVDGVRVQLGIPGSIVGDSDTQARFWASNTSVDGPYIRVPLDSEDRFISGNELTVEAWFTPQEIGTTHLIMAGPFHTGIGVNTFELFVPPSGAVSGAIRFTDASSGSASWPGPLTVGVKSHVVLTWDEKVLRLYVDGVLRGEDSREGKVLRVGNVDDFLYVAGCHLTDVYSRGDFDEPAFYEHPLSPDRVLAHYQAGAELGYAAEFAGERITDAATSDLWAETGILTGAHEVVPRMQARQSRLDVIREAARTEQPASLFFFNGDGDPVYLGWEYRATGTYNTTQATIGDATGEVPYESLSVVYDDEMFNLVTGSRENGTEQTVTDEDSRLEFRDRNHDITGLAVTNDEDVLEVANAILADHANPAIRVATVALNDMDTSASAQILARMPGDLIRVKRRPKGGTAIDIVTHIRGRRLSVGEDRVLSCEWALARGFNAATGLWQLGISGFSELNTTAVLA